MSELLRDVLNRCREGDEGALAELVRRFQPWALDVANSILRDWDLAEDAVLDSFLTAFQQMSSLREIDAFPGWFRQIIRTHSYRIARRRREIPIPEGMDLGDEHENVQDKLEWDDLRRRVREALQRLSPVGQETVELFYLDDLNCSEIADKLHIPEGTVKRRLHDGRKQLRGLLMESLGIRKSEPASDEGRGHGGFPL